MRPCFQLKVYYPQHEPLSLEIRQGESAINFELDYFFKNQECVHEILIDFFKLTAVEQQNLLIQIKTFLFYEAGEKEGIIWC